MTAPPESIGKIARALTELEPTAMKAKIREYLRGGLPAASLRDDAKGAESRLPLPDSFDRLLHEASRRYRQDLARAAALMERALRIQSGVLKVADPVPDHQHHPCRNPNCPNVLEGDLKSGECARCRKHRSRWRLAWPLLPDPLPDLTGQ